MRGFFLRVTGKKANGNLYYRFNRDGVGMTIWTGINVDVKSWESAIQSPAKWSDYTSEERYIDDDGKEAYRSTEGSRVKRLMDDVVSCVNKLIQDGKGRKGPDGKICEEDKLLFQKSIDNIVNHDAFVRNKKTDVDNLNHIIAFYDFFVKGIEEGSILVNNKTPYAKNSIRLWKAFRADLCAVTSEHMTFEMIDKFYVDKFYHNIEKHSDFGTTKHQKASQMRKLCALAAEYGKNNNAYSVSVWKNGYGEKSDRRTSIYMTDEEIDALYNLKLEGTMAAVRDMFFIGCMTCQRYSDFKRLCRSMFGKNEDGIPVIRLIQQKTKSKVEIPIMDDRIIEVCERYDFKFPQFSSVYFGTTMKKIARELAKVVPSLNEVYVTRLTQVEVESEKNYARIYAKKQRGEWLTISERQSLKLFLQFRVCLDGVHLWERDEEGNVLKPKYAMIMTHTARRSGITNLYNTGVFDTKELRAMSGHKSDENLDLYIKTSTSEQSTKIYNKMKKLKEERMAQKAKKISLKKAV